MVRMLGKVQICKYEGLSRKVILLQLHILTNDRAIWISLSDVFARNIELLFVFMSGIPLFFSAKRIDVKRGELKP